MSAKLLFATFTFTFWRGTKIIFCRKKFAKYWAKNMRLEWTAAIVFPPQLGPPVRIRCCCWICEKGTNSRGNASVRSFVLMRKGGGFNDYYYQMHRSREKGVLGWEMIFWPHPIDTWSPRIYLFPSEGFDSLPPSSVFPNEMRSDPIYDPFSPPSAFP